MSSNVPVARIVKQGGVMVGTPSPTVRERVEASYDALGHGAKSFVTALVGLWPITAVIAAGYAMCWVALVY